MRGLSNFSSFTRNFESPEDTRVAHQLNVLAFVLRNGKREFEKKHRQPRPQGHPEDRKKAITVVDETSQAS